MYNDNVEKLKNILKTGRYYGSIGSLMGWDVWKGQPVEARSYMQEISGFLIRESLAKLTSDESKYLVEYFKNYDIDSIEDIYQKRAIKKFIKQYDKVIKVPVDLQVEIRNATQQAQLVWEEAYKNSDYELFKPYMYKNFELKTREAEYLDNSKNPFEVLADSFDEGIDVENVSKLFTDLKTAIIPLIKQIADTGIDFELKELSFNYDKNLSSTVMVDILKKVGYNTNRSIWGEKMHPVTTGIGPRDARITTNFRSFEGTMFSFLHEMGHGIYNYSANEKAIEYSMWGGIGGAVHESQSRFYEIIVGRSKEFWKYFYPSIQENIMEFKNIDFDTYYKAINSVKPTIKRLEADELTYNLHPIIRFELEKDFYDGKIKIEEIREAWNEKYKEYLGITPKNDSEGVLQDVHWAMGYVGYFQSYTLGNIYDGQFLNKLLTEHPNTYIEIEKGNFSIVNNWLHDNIHQYGTLYTPSELIKKVTGEDLKSKYYIDYIKNKFSNLYGIN